MSVSNVISGSGEGGVTLWGVDLYFVDINVQESGGGARGFPKTGDWSEGPVAYRQDMEKIGRVEGNQGIKYIYTGYAQ